MSLGAIVIVRASGAESKAPATGSRQSLVEGPLSDLEVLGRTLLEHKVERLLAADVKIVSVLLETPASESMVAFHNRPNVKAQAVKDVNDAALEILKQYATNGISHAFITEVTSYTECDLIDLFWFHRESRRTITRASDGAGILDLWIVDCAKTDQVTLASESEQVQSEVNSGPTYFVSRYVNRLSSMRDVRRFVEDVLRGRCELRPAGKEIRPGVWVDEGAQIHRRARIVAPAYIGRGSKVSEDTVLTRFSNIESGCCIDYGTVIEQSSILQNSYVGIWLDIAHSIVKGSRLLNLDRNVLLEISDPSVIREQSGSRVASRRDSGAVLPALLAQPAE